MGMRMQMRRQRVHKMQAEIGKYYFYMRREIAFNDYHLRHFLSHCTVGGKGIKVSKALSNNMLVQNW